jgi:hypothetical protein
VNNGKQGENAGKNGKRRKKARKKSGKSKEERQGYIALLFLCCLSLGIGYKEKVGETGTG